MDFLFYILMALVARDVPASRPPAVTQFKIDTLPRCQQSEHWLFLPDGSVICAVDEIPDDAPINPLRPDVYKI